MSLAAGDRIGPYEILGLIGAGGMGEVYRARDTRLKRTVAIKVLPDAFASDTDRLARFQREAELLATLNHPNIAAVYGFEEASAAGAIVLELVDGPTLADRVGGGPLPLEDALTIARQIADALRAAHDRGVVHRDLKPANIKLTPGGTVKVLDFGLAKMVEPERRPSSSLSMSPTMSIQGTGAGMILGTAAYMSPEQARGKPADQRADIWAFGCVLYEMLTGRHTFETGETVSDAIVAILTHDPDWNALPPHVPQNLRRLLRRCLQRDPDRRLHHIADARLELDEADAVSAAVAPPQEPARTPAWIRTIPWAVAVLAIGLAAWALGLRPKPADASPSRATRLEVNLPTGVELFTGATRPLSVSPDGSRIAFIGVLGGTRMIYLRALDRFEAVPVKGSENATVSFFAPDGRSVAFVTSAGALKTISLEDGLVVTLADGVSILSGGAWGQDRTIVFVRAGALWRIPEAGGTAQQLTMAGGASQGRTDAWPSILPDGKTVLFSSTSGDVSRVEAMVLATGERRTLVDQGTMPLYTDPGYLVFFRNREVLAAPFDFRRLELTGPSLRLVENLPGSSTGTPAVDVSRTGTVVYAPTSAVSQLVWVSRAGTEAMLNGEHRSYANPRLSPDGTRLVVQAGDFWIQDLTRQTFTRLTSRATTSNGFPEWTPDGRRVVFRTSNGLRIQNAEGGGEATAIAGTTEFDYPSSFTKDGETLLFMRSTQETSFDVFTLPLRNPEKAAPILRTASYESGARLSPDGQRLAYISNESGQNEVYLRPFGGADRRWQVSTQGGTQAMWNPNGREIFYRNGNAMMAVDVSTGPDVVLSQPRLLFEQRYAYGAGITISNYDVSRDGQRFVMVKDESNAARVNVVINWFADLTRRATEGQP